MTLSLAAPVWAQTSYPVIPISPTLAPSLTTPPPPGVLPLQAPTATSGGPKLPVSLDTVLRLSKDANGQVRMARERLEEAFAKQDLNRRWLPDVTVGPSYYRHEGGIQDFQGNLIHSSYGSFFGGMELRGKVDFKDLAFKRIEAGRSVLSARAKSRNWRANRWSTPPAPISICSLPRPASCSPSKANIGWRTF